MADYSSTPPAGFDERESFIWSLGYIGGVGSKMTGAQLAAFGFACAAFGFAVATAIFSYLTR